LFEEHPRLIENNAELYFAALYNYLVACRAQKLRGELEEGLTKIKSLIEDTPVLGMNAIYVHYLELKDLYEQEAHLRIKENLEENILAHIKKFKQENEHLTVLCYIYLALNNLIFKDYHQVHFYLRRLFEKSKNLNNNYLRLFDTIELISHLETEDYKVADVLIATLKRKTRTSKDPSSFYSYILNSLRDIIRSSKEEHPKLISNFTNKWDEFEGDEFYQLVDDFFLKDWKTALQKGIPIASLKNSSQLQGTS